MSIEASVNPPVVSRTQVQPQPSPAGHDAPAAAEAEAEFTFDDFLDIINPLQHIPVLSILYRELTGDQMHGASRIIGGLLYGGPLGFIGGIVDAVAEQATGHDLADNAVAALFGGPEDAPPATTAVADAGAAPAVAATAADGGTPAAARSPGGPAVTDGPVVAGSTPAGGPAAPAPTAGAANGGAAESGSTEEAEAVLATAVLPHGMPVPARGAVPVRPLSTQPPGPARPVTINSRLDAALMAMATSGRPSAAPATASASAAPPAAAAASATASAAPSAALAPAGNRTPPGWPAAVPRDQIPAAMQRGLDQYRRSARAAEGLPPS